MKSEYGDRETLGTQLLKTHEEHLNSDPVDIYDLGNEMGKTYMKEILSVVEKHEKIIDKYYIQVIKTQEIYNKTLGCDRVQSFVFAARRSLPLMEPNVDVWFVDNNAGTMQVLWALPPYESMDSILAFPEKYHVDVINWISIYKDLEREHKSHYLKKSKHKKRK